MQDQAIQVLPFFTFSFFMLILRIYVFLFILPFSTKFLNRDFIYFDVGVKSPLTMMFYGLFRVRCTPTILSSIRHIVGLSSHFYVYAPLRSEQNEHPLDVLLHIGVGSKCLSSTYEQAHVDLDL